MKISNNQMFIKIKSLGLSFIAVLLFATYSVAQDEGEKLFKVKCATCHQVFKDGTGPKLYKVRQKWEENGAKEGSIYQWVNNFENAAASDPYAAEVVNWSATSMSKFPDLTKEQIDAIFDWIDSQEQKTESSATANDQGGDANVIKKEKSTLWVWAIIALILLTLTIIISSVRKQFKAAAASLSNEEYEKLSFNEELRRWAWENRKKVVVGAVLFVMALVVILFLGLYQIGVVEGYQPSQPIEFPHSVHAGTNGIDCKYCHNSVEKSKTAGLPTINVCMNCHKQISGSTPEQEKKIAKIYEAAGFDPAGGGKYTGEQKPIVWNKVHVLPDHVYFNHSQHVVAGGVDCKQCHGDMTKMKETAKVQTVEELNAVEGNIKLTKRTLTMGWCIECHNEKEVSSGPLNSKKNGYYDELHKRLIEHDKGLYEKYLEDGKVTVRELGGWECAKCHY